MEKKILQILQEVNEEIPDDVSVNLLERGIIDSVDIVNIVSTLESELSVEIEAEDILPENFCSVEAVVALLRSYGRC